MHLKEIIISDYKIKKDDVYISEFMDILKKLTSYHGVSQDSDTKYERNIMMNLLFRYGCSIAQKSIHQDHSFIIGGDMVKFLSVSNELDQDIIESYNNIHKRGKRKLVFKDGSAELSVSPDIVIHTSNESASNEPKYQHLILEAKTTKTLSMTAFFWDFLKLNIYKKKLGFRHLVYYIFGTSNEKIATYLDEYYKRGLYKEYAQDILFVIQPTLKDNVSIYKVDL